MRFAYVLLLFCSLAPFTRVYSQTTTNCLEVESILVDACSPNNLEGQNEMVRILVGPNPLTVNNIIPNWPNNPFGGWISNATTAQKTQELNNGIQSCGRILQPTGGIIPANKKAILVTSWDMNTTSNSFAGLTDTIYIIYQNSQTGNSGHFANIGTGTRTTSITYLGCTRSVTYDRSLLVGGDGAYVDFTQTGVASYGNNGCAAPISPFAIDAGPNPAAVCPGGTVTLNGSITGTSTYRQWSGGTGTFSAPGSSTTTYTLGAGQTSSFYLYFRVKGACPDTLKDSVLVTLRPQNPIQITANGPLFICNGQNLTLTASGGGTSYQWVGGPNTAQYTINSPGTYTVQSSDACYNYQQSITVASSNSPAIAIPQNDTAVCAGTSLQLTASGAGTIVWNTGATGSTITVNGPGTYIAGISNGCGVAADTVVISALPAPSVQITTTQPASICAGNQLTLTATGNGTLSWSNGVAGSTTTVGSAGTYTVTVTNACGTATASITVSAATPPTVHITNPVPAKICLGQTLTLTATGNGNMVWSNGTAGGTNPITAPGDYIVFSTNDCGASSDTISVGLNQAPYAQILTQGPITICPGTDVTLQGLGNGTLTWSNGGTGTGTTVNQAGTYTLISQTACGTDTAYITINAYPINAAFTATPTNGYAPLNVQTSDESAQAAGHVWIFGDGATSTDNAPAHTYTEPGTYDLVLAVVNAQGCVDTAVVQITVVNQMTVELPNIFTPNGDQTNDEYKIKATGVSSMKAEIYNRWGEKMFSWNDPAAAWNGQSPYGAPASAGVYYCVVEAVDAMGNKQVFKTTVTLIN